MWAAPGRVNLIGEHTDYNDGYVMPFALAQRVRRRRPRRRPLDRHVAVQRRRTSFGREDLTPGMAGWQPTWREWSGRCEAGHDVAGADLVLASDVPIGAGLSSSAALECAT